tara:strand:+ start:3195 stop:3608 length:414 start_codon:yes stop_codon:yes gene_type:complete
MNNKINIFSEEDLLGVSSFILSSFSNRVFAITGNLGSGKTTLIKNFCAYLGVKDLVSSPTFPIINEYICNSGEKIFHFDFYRLNTIQEALDIGSELYLNSGSYCFIEWPELIIPLLDEQVLFLNLQIESKKRVLTIL